jgi:alpha-galactosidase
VLERGGTLGPLYSGLITSTTEFLMSEPLGFPEASYELAGVVWLQGWGDAQNQPGIDEYEENLIDLAEDLRADLGLPLLPFVVVEGPDPTADIFAAREQAVASLELLQPETNLFVQTNIPLFEAGWFVPAEYTWHFNQSARNYVEVGLWTAEAVIDAGFVGGDP